MQVSASFDNNTERRVIVIANLQTAIDLYVSASVWYDAAGVFASSSIGNYDILQVGDTIFDPGTVEYFTASALFVTPIVQQLNQMLGQELNTFSGSTVQYQP